MKSRRSQRSTAREGVLDRVQAVLILFLVLFCPWAFGTTQAWSIWTANGVAYVLGAVWLVKSLRGRGGPGRVSASDGAGWNRDPWLWVAGIGTVMLFALVAVSLANARADFDPVTRSLNYLGEDVLTWLPTTYDRRSTVSFLAEWTGYALFFWATRDWLTGGATDRADDAADEAGGRRMSRVRLLLWVLCVNGAVLALIGLLQRAAGTSDLLWMVKSRSGKLPDAVFGPWSYRSNGAQYLNLVWPVSLGLWLWEQSRAMASGDWRRARFDGPQLVLIPCLLLMLIGVVVAGSRASALIAAISVVGAILVLLSRVSRGIPSRVRWWAVGFLMAGGLAGMVVGGARLMDRLSTKESAYPVEGTTMESDPFTLLVRMQVPGALPDRYSTVLALAPGSAPWWPSPGYLLLGLDPQGALLVIGRGVGMDRQESVEHPGFLEAHRGRTVDVAVVRDGAGIRLHVEGTVFPASGRSAEASSKLGKARILNRYLELSRPIIQGAGFVGAAMPVSALAGTAAVPVAEVVSGWDRRAMAAWSGSEIPVEPGPGGVVERSGAGDSGVYVRREGAGGKLGFRVTLPDGAGASGRLRVEIQGVAGSKEGVWLSAGRGGRLAEPEFLAGDGSSAPYWILPAGPSAEPAIRFEASTGGDGGGGDGALPAVRIRGLRLTPVGTSFSWPVKAGTGSWLARLGVALSGRGMIYRRARSIAADFPVWGTGGGTFESMYSTYRQIGDPRAAYVHDDWLEARVTLGRVGLTLLVTCLGALVAHVILGVCARMPGYVVALHGIALSGLLINAFGDFPFRIHSVALLFLTLAAVATAVSGRRGAVRSVGPGGRTEDEGGG